MGEEGERDEAIDGNGQRLIGVVTALLLISVTMVPTASAVHHDQVVGDSECSWATAGDLDPGDGDGVDVVAVVTCVECWVGALTSADVGLGTVWFGAGGCAADCDIEGSAAVGLVGFQHTGETDCV